MTEKGTDAKNADISKSSPADIRSAGVERGLAAATSAGIPWCLTGLLTERAVVCGAREHGTGLTKAWAAGIAASAASTEVGRIACAGPADKSSLEPEFGSWSSPHGKAFPREFSGTGLPLARRLHPRVSTLGLAAGWS